MLYNNVNITGGNIMLTMFFSHNFENARFVKGALSEQTTYLISYM